MARNIWIGTNMAAPLIGVAAAAAARLVAKKLASNAAKKSVKKVAPKASARQAGDYAVSGKSAKQTMPKAGKANAEYRYGKDSQISKNVSIKDTTSPSGKQFIRGGSAQVMNQNARLTQPLTKAEAKANARGLKAANKPLSKGNAKRSLEIKRMAGYIAYDRRPTPPSVKAAMSGKKPDGMRGAMAAAKKIAMQEARSEGPAKKISPAQKALNKKKSK